MEHHITCMEGTTQLVPQHALVSENHQTDTDHRHYQVALASPLWETSSNVHHPFMEKIITCDLELGMDRILNLNASYWALFHSRISFYVEDTDGQ